MLQMIKVARISLMASLLIGSISCVHAMDINDFDLRADATGVGSNFVEESERSHKLSTQRPMRAVSFAKMTQATVHLLYPGVLTVESSQKSFFYYPSQQYMTYSQFQVDVEKQMQDRQENNEFISQYKVKRILLGEDIITEDNLHDLSPGFYTNTRLHMLLTRITPN